MVEGGWFDVRSVLYMGTLYHPEIHASGSYELATCLFPLAFNGLAHRLRAGRSEAKPSGEAGYGRLIFLRVGKKPTFCKPHRIAFLSILDELELSRSRVLVL